jgi:hypothetical protein
LCSLADAIVKEERAVAYQTGATYAFMYQAVEDEAPSASGVYTIYTPQHWVYVGESDDIRRSLFGLLNEPSACMRRFGTLSFSFELVPPADRTARHRVLVAELKPECNGSGE